MRAQNSIEEPRREGWGESVGPLKMLMVFVSNERLRQDFMDEPNVELAIEARAHLGTQVRFRSAAIFMITFFAY